MSIEISLRWKFRENHWSKTKQFISINFRCGTWYCRKHFLGQINFHRLIASINSFSSQSEQNNWHLNIAVQKDFLQLSSHSASLNIYHVLLKPNKDALKSTFFLLPRLSHKFYQFFFGNNIEWKFHCAGKMENRKNLSCGIYTTLTTLIYCIVRYPQFPKSIRF